MTIWNDKQWGMTDSGGWQTAGNDRQWGMINNGFWVPLS